MTDVDAGSLGACTNHPQLDATQRCVSCGQPFCESCLVTFVGEPHCGPCRDQRLAGMHGQPTGEGLDAPLAGSGQVDLGGWLSTGMDVLKADPWPLVLAVLVTVLLGTITLGIMYGPLMCGIYVMAFRRLAGRPADMSNMFDTMKRVFLNAFLTMLIIFVALFVLNCVSSLPGFVVGWVGGDNAGAAGMVMLLNLAAMAVQYIGQAVVLGVTIFALPHVAATNAGPADALRASWEVVSRNPVMFIVTAFVFSLIQGIGIVACCVGMFFTIALVAVAEAKAYADHFGVASVDTL